MPFDIKEGLTSKIGPLPAWAYGLLAAGGFLAYRRFFGGGTTVQTDTYGNPAADLAQTDPAEIWPGGFGIGGSSGLAGNTGDPTDPTSGTPYLEPIESLFATNQEYLAEMQAQNQSFLSDFLAAMPQTWGLGDTPLQVVVSHDNAPVSNDVTNGQGTGGPPPSPVADTRLGNDNPARVPSLNEFLATHPADNKTAAGRARLTETWQRVFGARYASYTSATSGTPQAPVHALTGGGAPPPRVGVAPAVQPVVQQRAALPAATTNASGMGRQVGPWRTAAMRDAAVAPAIAAGKRVRKFSTGANAYYAEIIG